MNETNNNMPETAPSAASAEMPKNPFADNQPDLTKPQFEAAPSYANVLKRFVAVLIDGILVGIVSAVISAVTGGSSSSSSESSMNLVTYPIMWVYSVFMLVKFGQTLGKKAMGIKVVKESTGQNLDVASAILREVVGKFLSGAVLLLGYLWAFWDSKKQAWHDKIAKSIVINA